MLGFSRKILVIQAIIRNSLILFSLVIITGSVISLYYYFRILYSSTINLRQKNAIIFTQKPIKPRNIFLTSATVINIITPILLIY